MAYIEKSDAMEETVGVQGLRTMRSAANMGRKATLMLAATSLGIIYGDIGTSPLYVFNAIFPSGSDNPSTEDIIGALSAIIWAITIVPLIKYSFIALEFGNSSGEGGPFAVYTSIYPPPEEFDGNRELTSYPTTSGTVDKSSHSFLDRAWVKGMLFSWVIFGTCLTISDGLLTPAVSVVSAVEGMAVAAPAVNNLVVPLSVVILLVLFAFQTLGTRRVGVTFAPIVAGWLILIAGSGCYNITYFPSVFRALDPSRAVMLFVRTGNFDLLSGVLLAITGVEAMFANLGQFSKSSIRLGFSCFVYPCLILAYLGQGARLITDPTDVLPNVFFNSIPGPVSGPFWWITWVFAIAAAVIASQAMISATFSLVQQLTRLHAMPSVKIVHTDDVIAGQVYSPVINVMIMIGTVALTVGFGTNTNLTNAYGCAVAGVLIVTTSIIAVAIVRLKHLPIFVAIGFFLVSGFFDGLFFGSSLKKVPIGAWFPLGLALVLCSFFLFWTWAKGLEDNFDATHRYRLNRIVEQSVIAFGDESTSKDDDGIEPVPALSKGYGEKIAMTMVDNDAKVARVPVFALFHNQSASTLNGAPHSLSTFMKCYPSLPTTIVLFNIVVTGVAHTEAVDRFVVSRVPTFDGIYVATLRLGYRDPIDLEGVAAGVREAIVGLERRSGEGGDERIRRVEVSIRTVTHIIPYFHVSAQASGPRLVHHVRKFLIESIYRRIKVNFIESDSYIFGDDDAILRIGVAAEL